VVLLLAAVLVSGCGASGPGELIGGAVPKAATAAQDSWSEGFAKAVESVKTVAPDAVLVSSGTSGLALADVPNEWSYSFLSPSDKSLHRVLVQHGRAAAPEKLGEAKVEVDLSGALAGDAVKVGGATAVKAARKEGEKSGKVPMNVMVVGSFIDVPGGAELGISRGVWRVTFANDTSGDGSAKFDVDMETEAVTAVKE
jgi:hypothetical protein